MPKKPAGRTCPACKRHYVGRRGRCDRCEEGYRTVVTSDGPVELLLPRWADTLHAQVVVPALRLAPEASSADFVAILLKAVVERTADHVPERHATWLAAQLHSLMTSQAWARGSSKAVPLSEHPHADLGFAVHSWVQESITHAAELPLLPYFRVEAARFVRAHYEGGLFTGYTIEGAVPRSLAWTSFGHLDGAPFKREFTRRYGGVDVRGVVPPGGRLAVKYGGREWKPGKTFEFCITRCHLSEGWEHYTWLVAEEDEPGLDFFRDFAGYGPLGNDHSPTGKVPFAWFTHQRVRTEADPERPHDWKWEWRELPEWLRASPLPESQG